MIGDHKPPKLGSNRLARRYAEAIFSLAREENRLDELEAELGAANQLFTDLPELRALLVHPEIQREEKIALLERVFAGRLSAEAVSFLRVLVQHRRHELLSEVVEEFAGLANEARNLVKARVASVVPLSRDQAGRLQQCLARRTGKRVELAEEIEPLLLAGVRVWLGDQMIDGSAAGRLAELRTILMSIGRERG